LGCISYFQENPIEFNDEVVAIWLKRLFRFII
jgi:hypothetical protein